VFLAAENARKVDPTRAARYFRPVADTGKHHNSAVCTIAGVLFTRLATCWPNGERHSIRDVDGTEIDEASGRAISAEHFKIPPAVRAARPSTTTAHKLKTRTGRGSQESTEAAPATGPPPNDATARRIAWFSQRTP
jgi:hypothetical protein